MASESSKPSTALGGDDNEDKAQSTLGKQSALVSMLSMGIYLLISDIETDFGFSVELWAGSAGYRGSGIQRGGRGGGSAFIKRYSYRSSVSLANWSQ